MASYMYYIMVSLYKSSFFMKESEAHAVKMEGGSEIKESIVFLKLNEEPG